MQRHPRGNANQGQQHFYRERNHLKDFFEDLLCLLIDTVLVIIELQSNILYRLFQFALIGLGVRCVFCLSPLFMYLICTVLTAWTNVFTEYDSKCECLLELGKELMASQVYAFNRTMSMAQEVNKTKLQG
ncbi:hypothetical protein FGO68_gene12073 [Halteria grandinella]|uniref:Uncharacterized protein n=1 Tax=Halteria grandinella TaxID=5974 RepID=A0A8J8NXS6_HALGN|nr:hypothetical protein FGO68_gene12073 [Halteria grandinella]